MTFWLLTVSPVGADPIRGEFWIRADLMEIVSPGENLRETGELSEREENALKVLLEDARWAFSGMIYGYSVTWTPSSAARYNPFPAASETEYRFLVSKPVRISVISFF